MEWKESRMTYYANKPSELGYADGTAANNTNTGGAAGSDLGSAVTSGGGTITYLDGAWRFRRGPTSSSVRFDKTVDTSVRYSVEARLNYLAQLLQNRALLCL